MRKIVSRHLVVDGMRIAYQVYGCGEPVVLIHGTPSSSYIWRNVLPQLLDAGYRVYLYDLLGYGSSERPQDSDVDTSVTGQVAILENLMESWELFDAHIVAHDIGGAIAQRFAIECRPRTRSLTLIDTVSFDSWPSKRTREQMREGLEELEMKSDREHREHFREWLLSAVHDKKQLIQSSLDVYLDLISGPVGKASFFQHQVRHYDSKHTEVIADRLGELGEVPVQLIWGQDDQWQNVAWAHKLHDAIPGSLLHILENCGHFAMEDKPEEIGRLLVTFLEEAKPFGRQRQSA
ncbi:MAG: alpha/beta hydrolase [Gammaproteobacteria bacterium]|nr:alpha/beta hydrolase [Gammaproteobacteria bacterium]MYJ51489.1 alpha/beta hydrolase [Gammaproteobacteria bacterium]